MKNFFSIDIVWGHWIATSWKDSNRIIATAYSNEWNFALPSTWWARQIDCCGSNPRAIIWVIKITLENT